MKIMRHEWKPHHRYHIIALPADGSRVKRELCVSSKWHNINFSMRIRVRLGRYLQSRDWAQREAQSSRVRPCNIDTRAEFQEVGTSSLPSERWKSFRGLRDPVHTQQSHNHSLLQAVPSDLHLQPAAANWTCSDSIIWGMSLPTYNLWTRTAEQLGPDKAWRRNMCWH